MSSKSIVDISITKNKLIVEVDQKLSAKLLSYRNDDFHEKPYPIAIDRNEIKYLLDGIDSRLRHIQELKFQFFDTLDHDLICRIKPITTVEVRCSFSLPGSVVKRDFVVTDQNSYLNVVHTAFRDFILTVASLLENLVRLTEILVTKVIISLPNRRSPAGTEPLHIYREFMGIFVKLEYRTKDDLHTCFSAFDPFFDKYFMALYKLRGSFIHGYRENLIADGTGVCSVRRHSGDSFKSLSATDLIADQFTDTVYTNMEKLTVDLIECITKKIANPAAKIPI